MSNYATSSALEQSEIDAYGGALDAQPAAKPKKSKHRPVKCRQPGCKREIIPDGYGEWIHADNWLYSCTEDLKDKGDIRVAKR